MRPWSWFLACFHLSDRAVCEMSKGRLPNSDFHRLSDAKTDQHWDLRTKVCKRCGKMFVL